MEKQQKTKKEKQTDQANDESVEEVVKSEEIEEDDPQEIIENLTQQIEVLQDKLLRQLAESENIRTRSAKLVEEAREYAIFDFTIR